MKIYKINYYFLLVCFHLYFTVCSMEKVKSDKKQYIDQKQIKENTETKETAKLTEEKEAKETISKQKYYKRKTFKTKEDIPEDYVEDLKKLYNIREDPAADYDRKVKEMGNFNYDFYSFGSDYDTYGDVYTDDDYEQKEQTNEVIEHDSEMTENNSTDLGESSSNTTCQTCETLEADKKLRLESIKSMILNKIGFSSEHLPNMTGKNIPRIPSIQRLIESHEMQGDAPYNVADEYLPEDDVYGQVRRAYTIAQKPPEKFKIQLAGGCYFDLPESVKSRKITDASLWIYIEPSAIKRKEVVFISVYIIPHKAKSENILEGPVRYKKTTSSGWIEFKFSHIVHHWVKHPEANRGIVLQALDEEGNNLAVTPGSGYNEEFVPVLEMSTMDYRDEHSIRKRSVNMICTGEERRESCCRYPLRVDFVQFGWDWVIAPTGYMANFCSGECKYRHMENNPQAYLIQQTPDENGPCCTPSKYFPLAMLYFDHQHNVLYTHMQKMIVVRCGCA